MLATSGSLAERRKFRRSLGSLDVLVVEDLRDFRHFAKAASHHQPHSQPLSHTARVSNQADTVVRRRNTSDEQGTKFCNRSSRPKAIQDRSIDVRHFSRIPKAALNKIELN